MASVTNRFLPSGLFSPRLLPSPRLLHVDPHLAMFLRESYAVAHVMTEDIRKLIHAEPFVPFVIHTADGGVLPVPTVDHVAVPPGAKRIFVFGDDGTYDVLSPLLVTRLSVEHGDPASSSPSF